MGGYLPLFGFIGFGILFTASAITIICTGVLVAQPGFWAQDFQDATCEYVNTTYFGVRSCSCGGGQNYQCQSQYPCYLVTIKYLPPGSIQSDNSYIVTTLYEDETLGIERGQCSYLPSCNPSAQVNGQAVLAYLSVFATQDASYSCLYNPAHPTDVIRTRRFDREGIVASLAVPGVFVGISAIGTIGFGLMWWNNGK